MAASDNSPLNRDEREFVPWRLRKRFALARHQDWSRSALTGAWRKRGFSNAERQNQKNKDINISLCVLTFPPR
jgi:hypothetical protein